MARPVVPMPPGKTTAAALREEEGEGSILEGGHALWQGPGTSARVSQDEHRPPPQPPVRRRRSARGTVRRSRPPMPRRRLLDGTLPNLGYQHRRACGSDRKQGEKVSAIAYSPDGRGLGRHEYHQLYRHTLQEPGEGEALGGRIRPRTLHTRGPWSRSLRCHLQPHGCSRWPLPTGIVRIWDTLDLNRGARVLRGHTLPPCAPRGLPPGRPATRHRRGHAVSRRPFLVRRRGEALDLATGRCSTSSAATRDEFAGWHASPDGRRLATASDDRTLKLWDTSTGQEVFTLR